LLSPKPKPYQDMWVNNSAAMYRYQAAWAQAVALPHSLRYLRSPMRRGWQLKPVGRPPLPLPHRRPRHCHRHCHRLPPASTPAAAGLDWRTYANQFISSGFPINLLSYLAQNTQAQVFQGLGDIGKGLSEGEDALEASEAELSSAISAAGAAKAPMAALGVGVSFGWSGDAVGRQ